MKQKEKNKKYRYYEIKVSIKDTHPPVWRRLLIPEGITFHELNAIIQLAFDWCGYHAYSFEVGSSLYRHGTFIQLPELGDDFYGTINSKKEKIDNYFEEYKKIKYTYDFGDNWVHDIIIEKIIEADEKLDNPICIKAKMAPLPEDCGGPYGYEELLAISDDGNYERMYVDIEQINMKLEKYKEYAKFLCQSI